jgi:hypothetical protein
MMKPRSLFERYRDAQPNAIAVTPEAEEGGMLEKAHSANRVVDETSDEKSGLASKLERVTEKAIEKTDEILDLPLPSSDHPTFGAVLRAQNAAANTVLNTQTKVDENRLRATAVNKLPELLEILKEEQINLAMRRATKNE